MEHISCPSCGKSNPIDNKFCDFCLSNLHPNSSGEEEFGAQIPSINAENQGGLGGHESDAQEPNWLGEMGQSSQAEREEPPGLESHAGQQSDSVTEWMSEVSGEGEGIPEVKSTSPFLPGQEIDDSPEIPQWLNDALIEPESPGSIDDENVPQTPAAIDGLDSSSEDLPVTPFSEETLGNLEDAGPLAGLKGILSAEAGAARARKPKAYSSSLKISPSQRAHIDLLTSLVEAEGQPHPLPERKIISQQNIMRWVIALVLLLAVLWPLVIGGQDMPFPVYDEGSSEVNRLINQLPENARILVGFDFEPGLSTEMDAAAAPVITHLMEQGALLTLISTSPSGPLLAERFMQSTQSGLGYINGLDYINLGYLPGGAAGLVSFFDNPQGTILYSIDGIPLWEADGGSNVPVLGQIDQVTDYDMVMVLVDDPETAQGWIEQLGPRLTDPLELTSLVLITSAQLEPVVRPYYDGLPQLVNGLVVGLRGGAAYARLVGGEDLLSQYWDAFGWGTFMAAMLILVGGLGYYVVPELTRSAKGQEKVEP
ncbi:MAG: hypothetical protein ACWGN2_01370 [Anaerolineales bacterium]